MPAPPLHFPPLMSEPSTFFDLARALAEAGAAESCAAQAAVLEARAEVEPESRRAPLRSGARGLRAAARVLSQLAPTDRVAPFRPIGLRGALAAGHLALAEGRAAQAELVGEGIAEAAPRCPAGLRLVGQALFAQGRFHLAVRALRGALAADANDPFTRALHAEALWFAGEQRAARCALAMLRASRKDDALGAALDAAFRSGALDRAGRAP
jgi:Flp pilus assembly protein TadD